MSSRVRAFRKTFAARRSSGRRESEGTATRRRGASHENRTEATRRRGVPPFLCTRARGWTSERANGRTDAAFLPSLSLSLGLALSLPCSPVAVLVRESRSAVRERGEAERRESKTGRERETETERGRRGRVTLSRRSPIALPQHFNYSPIFGGSRTSCGESLMDRRRVWITRSSHWALGDGASARETRVSLRKSRKTRATFLPRYTGRPTLRCRAARGLRVRAKRALPSPLAPPTAASAGARFELGHVGNSTVAPYLEFICRSNLKEALAEVSIRYLRASFQPR